MYGVVNVPTSKCDWYHISGIIFELFFEFFEECECIRGSPSESSHDMSVVEFAQFGCGVFDDTIAEGDLTISGHGYRIVFLDGEYGGRVKAVHG